MRRLVFALMILAFVTPVSLSAAELPKCRNIAGYEPKPTCQARNQRAEWQAEQTAKMTAQLVAQAMSEQAAAAQANEKGLMDTLKGAFDGAVSTVSGFFN